jgi:RNA polymerase sigma-70 factor (ECF subfamily)
VDLYTPLLLYWARGLGLNSQDSADLVQEVFTVLVQKLPTFKYDQSKTFRGWLRTLAVNKWRDIQRRKKLPMESRGDLSGLSGPDAVEAFWEHDFQKHLVRRALKVMKAEFQPTTWKACWEMVAGGRSGAEVARELGVTENAVYVAKYKVIRRLRQELKGLIDPEAC